MINTRRTKRLAAFAVGLSLVAAACGGDDSTATTTAPTEPGGTTAPTEPGGTTAPTEPGDTTPETTASPTEDVAMTLTVDLNPDAVWDDGTPITVADLQCTLDANLNTPGSLTTTGFDQIISVDEGSSDKQAVINFRTVYAPYKTLFNPILKADRHADCNDVSLDFEDTPPDSGRPFKFQEWTTSQSILVPNENYWGDAPASDQVVMVPFADQDTEKAAIASGEVDYIYPQYDPGFAAVTSDANVSIDLVFGADYEGFYFQQYSDGDGPWTEGPFADPIYRQAFAMSIDTASAFQQIYTPIGGPTAELLNCGPITPGPYCPDNATAPFANSYDADGAKTLLEDNGWTMGGDGLWVSPDGEVPEVRWIINTGNTRREGMQAYLIPLLAAAGFNVVPDNCDAACYFQQRLPAMDYDMAMYISTAPPDPAYLTSSFTCSQIPTPENGNVGQNSTGWCNEAASDALAEADATVDEAERAELILSALQAMADDHVMLPLFQFPKSGIWRNDQVGSPEAMAANTNNYMAFARSIQDWEDLNGDGQVVHRCRAVARVPQPDHRVRQLVLVRVDGVVLGDAGPLGHHQRPGVRDL